ncbi:MAG: alcohol dehydrogenase catalytic domain-containing protein [Aerococcus sp.]|nr:alcohol dehydrogenase catalytic domain-containing protein [Aerococcus sp.]
MKADYINQFGPATNIQVGTLPDPVCQEGEVLVETIATTVNHVDTFVRSGQYLITAPLPFVVGRDLVGRVKATHSDKSTFTVGDLVWSNSMGYEDRAGTTSSLVAVPSDRLFHLPEGVDPYKAVSAFHATTTAVLILTERLHPSSGERILIQGGAGNVASKLIETILLLGLEVTTTCAVRDFPKFEQWLVECVDYHDQDYPFSQYDYIIDTSGKNTLQHNLSLLKKGGSVVIITKPIEKTFDAWSFYTKQQQIVGFVLSQASAGELSHVA